MSEQRPTSVLFVCLGNICRSPLAEGVFRHLVEDAGAGERYRIDSAGTGAWHVGEPPDRRASEVARRHGVELAGRARQVRPDDFSAFDLVLAMDRANFEDLERLRSRAAPPATGELRIFREFDPERSDGLEVPDPYYGGPDGFEHVYGMVRRTCEALLRELEADREG